MAINEKEFLSRYSDAKRLPEGDSETVRAYASTGYLWLFDKEDGHLAWEYHLGTHEVLFECEHIKKGKREK